MWPVLKLAARSAAWRTTPAPPLAGLPVLLGFAASVAAVRILLQLAAAGSWHRFTPYGLNAVAAWIAIELAIAALFVRPAARTTALSAMLILSILAEIFTSGFQLGVPVLAPVAAQSPLWTGGILTNVIYAVTVIWWIGAAASIVNSLDVPTRLRSFGRAAGLWAALFFANALMPQAPVFIPTNFDARSANWWEFLYALYQEKNGGSHTASAEIARIAKAQPALLQSEIARLAPSRKDITEVYALGIAGWADEGVFIKELDGGLQSIGSILPIKDHTIRLVNQRATLDTTPLADLQNFQAAVHAIGGIMDKSKDVLVLFMTSHGEKTGFALELPGTRSELTPQQVTSALDNEGINDRVVIVSACYSGIFVPPLQNANTIILTASDANSTSFGCAPERDWTYFGDAFFRQSLHPGTDLKSAFDHARILIQGWELMDHAAPSNPQGEFGSAVAEKLAPFFTAAQAAVR